MLVGGRGGLVLGPGCTLPWATHLASVSVPGSIRAQHFPYSRVRGSLCSPGGSAPVHSPCKLSVSLAAPPAPRQLHFVISMSWPRLACSVLAASLPSRAPFRSVPFPRPRACFWGPEPRAPTGLEDCLMPGLHPSVAPVGSLCPGSSALLWATPRGPGGQELGKQVSGESWRSERDDCLVCCPLSLSAFLLALSPSAD